MWARAAVSTCARVFSAWRLLSCARERGAPVWTLPPAAALPQQPAPTRATASAHHTSVYACWPGRGGARCGGGGGAEGGRLAAAPRCPPLSQLSYSPGMHTCAPPLAPGHSPPSAQRVQRRHQPIRRARGRRRGGGALRALATPCVWTAACCGTFTMRCQAGGAPVTGRRVVHGGDGRPAGATSVGCARCACCACCAPPPQP
jgi:hypothetical protein